MLLLLRRTSCHHHEILFISVFLHLYFHETLIEGGHVILFVVAWRFTLSALGCRYVSEASCSNGIHIVTTSRETRREELIALVTRSKCDASVRRLHARGNAHLGRACFLVSLLKCLIVLAWHFDASCHCSIAYLRLIKSLVVLRVRQVILNDTHLDLLADDGRHHACLIS